MYSFLSTLTVSTQRAGAGTTPGFGFNHTLPSLCYASAVISACCCITLLNQTPTKQVNGILHPPRVEQLQDLGQSTLNSDSQEGTTVTHNLENHPGIQPSS